MVATCPTESTLLPYLHGSLSTLDATTIEQHLERCPDCRAAASLVADALGLGQGGPAPGAPPDPPREFDGYQLGPPLGRGAMGWVCLGHDTTLDRPVAIKFMGARLPAIARERFQNEARAVARVQHPNVVTIYRAGEVAGLPYLVAEYVPGVGLDQVRRPLPWRRALAIGAGLARGLAAAHRKGVLHRDIKPANAILADDGTPKLLDFGLAKLIAPDSAGDEPAAAVPRTERDLGVTHTGALLGTPRYLAPERWRREPATYASDVYALGVVLYELCAGRSPFEETTREGLSEVVQNVDPPPLGVVAPQVAPALAAVVDRCLRRDPPARFRSGEDLSRALEDIRPDPAPAGRRRAVLIAVLTPLVGAALLLGLWQRPASPPAPAPWAAPAPHLPPPPAPAPPPPSAPTVQSPPEGPGAQGGRTTVRREGIRRRSPERPRAARELINEDVVPLE